MIFDIRLILGLGKCKTTLLCIGLSLLFSAPVHADLTAEDGPRIGAIVKELASDNDGVRQASMREFMQYGQAALPFLVGIREYGSPSQRRGAIIGMALLPIPALATEHIFEGLGDPDTATRSLSARTLAMIGQTVAPQLTAALNIENPLACDAAAYSLHLMGKKAIPSLISALKSKDIITTSKAAWLLGRLGNDALSAVPALTNALSCPDIRVMHVIAEAIDLIEPPSALLYYHCLLIGVKQGYSTQQIGKDAAPTLTRLLTRPGTPLGQAAFRTLASIGNSALPALREAVKSGTLGQRTAASLLLVKIDPSAVHTLPEDIRATLAGVRPQSNQ